MKFKIIFVFFIVCQISLGYLIKRSTSDKPICYNSNSCGWQIDKKNGEVEYFQNHCRCKSDEECLRTAIEYRLPGWKYHCKRKEEIRDDENVFIFPIENFKNEKANSSIPDD